VLRLYLELMQASTRTNFYQPDANGAAKSCVSFKLDPSRLSDLPRPRPVYEIFVYSPERLKECTCVAVRWPGVDCAGRTASRDYRTEILGLVKSPAGEERRDCAGGGKGGFVAKQLPSHGGRDAIQEAGKAAYSTFIRALLDLTDNFIDGKVIPAPNVIRHDDEDYYLVVAADKGTATFSDIANGISREYGFWLEDAFASGGSYGYDHKKMGITAKGSWVR